MPDRASPAPGRPLVSIVTPTLNQGRFIGATLRSVRAQTYPNIEHIVVDGGSTDGTVDMLAREAAGDALRFVTEPDAGMYDAINKGFAMAKGEIFGYLASDDVYFPWAVEAALAAFEAHPDADLVFGDGIKVDERTGVQRLRLFPPFDGPSLAQFESIMQPAVFWRRRVSETIGPFDSGLRYVADLDYWLRAAEAGLSIVHVDEALAIERIHGERQSEASRDAMAAENAAMRARHHGPDAGPDARTRARRRFRAWQRRLWLRFLAASVFGGSRGPWPRLRAQGDLRLSRLRILLGQLPRGRDRFLRAAVVSRLAETLLHAGPSAADTMAPTHHDDTARA